ncbi:conjugative relaxase [Sandaracinobacter neustonicus]|uniref:Conjugative relaxase n=1 Tax=Sandaracinobacter neustonicus TaxID=1715348 RepID=A0A501XDG1_9SPHN|nr:MobF family relaxase [Sandaracinobacter neustonicus]TPE58562.1 conjugative relaxase [Sandaracinobacter neustonicus]
MINVTALRSAAAASSYYRADNYYSTGEAIDASAWYGAGAQKLGLVGRVDEQVFAEVLEGRLPNGAVIAAPRGDHRPGTDITFSAPKSLSLLALLAKDERLTIAFRESVSATLTWAEKSLIEARVWNSDMQAQQVEKTGNLVAATFLHTVNRNQEPQLHVHVVLANATLASDQKWHAIRNDELYKNQHQLGAIHNAELRSRVEALGYETVPAKNPVGGAFEVKGVSREVVEAFSTRRSEILEALAKGDRGSPRERELAALATRQAKNPEFSPEQRQAQWLETAERVGFDGRDLIADAIVRSARQQTIWSKALENARGIGVRGLAIVSAMGLTPRDGDPLVPERLGRLDPRAYAAAQAVASAARELGEREAAFDRSDLIRAALERGGPVTVADVEARIAHLTGRGLLLGGERLMTTESALSLEQRVITLAHAGRDAVPPLATGVETGPRLQQAARDLGLRRLNPGQEQAGVDILQSTDRVVLVQGGAGVGKSAALISVAHLLKAEGRSVFALAHAGRTARDLGAKLDAPTSTVDSFLGKFSRVLDGSASTEQMARGHDTLSGSVIIVDEASQIGNERLARLIDLSNRAEVARLILAGDVKQLPAIEAGKPFELLQTHAVFTSTITENLRARSPQMLALNAALENADMARAFEVLKPDTREVPFAKGPETAARLWAGLSAEQRDKTLLLASGRAMRTAANVAVQQERIARGELGGQGQRFDTLDRVTITREGARQMKGYQPGRTVEFRTSLPSQGFARGDRGEVYGADDGKVQLRMADGTVRQYQPDRLPRNLAHDAVSIFEPKTITLFEGDRIRWTDNDRERGLLNGDIANIEKLDRNMVSVRTVNGDRHTLARTDPMLERLDLAYAVNVHVAQGMTAERGIILMSEREKMLNSTRSFLVAITRIAEHATLVVDSARGLERSVAGNAGDKTSAIEAVNSTVLRKSPEREPDITSSLGQTRQRDVER